MSKDITNSQVTTLMVVKMTKQQSNKDFVNELFDNLFKHVDTDMIDLHDDDSCCDHIQFEQLALDVL